MSTGEEHDVTADALTGSWPELGEELARKATDVLDDAAYRCSEGEITEREFALILKTLIDTTSGLVPKELFHFLAKLHTKVSKKLNGKRSAIR